MRSLSLCYYRLQIRFFADTNVRIGAWIGAVLRNNFLVQAEQVKGSDGISLFAHMEALPLSDEHPCRKQLQGGFPKGIWLDCRDIPYNNRVSLLNADRIYSFRVIIAGRYIQYYEEVVEALKRMLDVGFGHPGVPLKLIDISECDEAGTTRLLCHPDFHVVQAPRGAIRLSDFVLDNSAPERALVKLQFETPVSLIRPKVKKAAAISFQDKLNCFPSFYQFMRSLVYRVSTLDMLYGEMGNDLGLMENEIDDYVLQASEAILQKADLDYRKVRSTPKKGTNHVYVMDGYTGTLVWGDVPSKYLPLLVFATGLGVGNNVQYGLGSYSITISEQTK